MNTPVLLITFNRPMHTRKVLEVVLRQNPSALYVFQDGARKNNDTDLVKCNEVRGVIDELTQNIDFQVYKFYSDKNLGCGPGPKTALDWFFSENEYGIVLEDDAVPHPDFFPYCEELLLKYKDDKDVRAIGSMHLDTKTFGDGSYYFSMMNRTFCAWATWARAWKDFDLYHRNVTRRQFNQCLKAYGCGLRMREYWCERLAEVQKDAYHNSSWDQQFWMSIWLHHGKGIMPNVNLDQYRFRRRRNAYFFFKKRGLKSQVNFNNAIEAPLINKNTIKCGLAFPGTLFRSKPIWMEGMEEPPV